MRKGLRQIIIGIGIVSLITFLFIEANVSVPDGHDRFSHHLRDLKELDATLNKDVLESRYGLMTSYDSLIAANGEMSRLMAELRNTPEFLESGERQRIESLLVEYGDLQIQKEPLVEQFKSQNSIINDSVHHFSVAASNVTRTISVNSSHHSEVGSLNALLRDVLKFYLLTDRALEPAITDRIRSLEQQQLEPATRVDNKDYDLAIAHARTIVRLKPEIDGLVRQILTLPTDQKIKELIDSYDSYYYQSLYRADMYRKFLYLISILMLAYIGFTIFRLRKVSRALNEANETLELHVSERTAELETSNEDLKNEIAERRRLQVESEIVSEIVRGITTTSNLDELLGLIHQSIQKIIYAENCFVALYEIKTETLGMEFFVDKFDTVPPPSQIGRGLTAYVFRKGQPVLMTPEIIQQLTKQGEIDLIGTAPAIWLGVPLRTPTGTIGVLVVQHYEDATVYSDRDLELLAAVGDQIALAIERKRVEEALRTSEEQHRLLFETNPQPAYIYDLGTFAFLAVNDAAIRHYGYSREEFLKRITIKDIRPAEEIPSFLERVSKVTPGSASILVPSAHKKRNGTVIDVEITSHSLVFDGQPAEIVLVNDVTERKQAEEKLRIFNEKLQQSNRELQDFAYVASHDLQEPLRKVQAFSDRLKTKYADQLDGNGLDYLERMRSAASRMQLLIQDLLSFSRVTTKAQPFIPVNLETVAKEVLTDLEVKIEETGARVELKDLPTLDADPLQMRQLMQNLIGNALKFQQEGATPFINVEAHPITTNGPNGGIQISFSDNGIGFDEKYVDKIFAVFQRLHGRGQYEGSGVGLAICRKIVERHNGNITVRSKPGEGTTFLVTLPRTQGVPEVTEQ